MLLRINERSLDVAGGARDDVQGTIIGAASDVMKENQS